MSQKISPVRDWIDGLLDQWISGLIAPNTEELAILRSGATERAVAVAAMLLSLQ
jgi:hypothetical protein